MSRLSQRVRQLEERSDVGGRYVRVPLPGQPGQFLRLPRAFVMFLVERLEADQRADGRVYNYTDQRWVEVDHDDRIRQNPTS